MDQLGINIINILIYTALFFIMWAVIHNLLLKKLSSSLAMRQKLIQEGVEKTETADEIVNKAQQKFDEITTDAKKEASVIRDLAKKDAEAEKQLVLKEAREKAKEIIFEAEDVRKQSIAEDKKDFERKLNERVNEKLLEMAKTGLVEVNIEKTLEKI